MDMGENEVLKMNNITKNFPGVKALSNVDFTLRAGEIHALMGENGAGKSTLIKVLTGVEEFETGHIMIDGRTVVNKSPQEAQLNGISTVYQEINLCPNLSVAENIYIGRQPMKHGAIDWRSINKSSKELLLKLSIDIDVTKTLENYSIAIQQMVAIARAVDISSKILILDEPTSSLDELEVTKLFDVIHKLKADGLGIIFVTHFLDQVYQVCDRITVLRNGCLVGEYTIGELPRVQLVAKMMGKEFDELATIKKTGELETKMTNDNIMVGNGLARTGSVNPFDITINKGEVIGVAGLLGSGRSELARLLYGADKADSGDIYIKGKNATINAPIDAMKHGMAFCPENRKTEGIIADLSVRENINIALQAQKGLFKLISKKAQQEFADRYIELLKIKASDTEVPVKNLSGGNQQKVILARWLLTQPQILILDEPTRGIDVGTKTEIQKLIVKLADGGMAIVFISSEIEEMLRCCNRMIVMRDRNKISELSENELSQSNIMSTIAGGVEYEKTR